MATKGKARGRYRSYNLYPNLPIPRTTQWRNKKKRLDDEASNSSNIIFEPEPAAAVDIYHDSHQLNEENVVCNSETVWVGMSENDNEFGMDDRTDNPEIEDSYMTHNEDINETIEEYETADSGNLDLGNHFDMFDFPGGSDESHEDDTSSINVEEMFQSLYPGADITVCGVYCAIMKLKNKCNLTFRTIGELLKLLKLICPPDSKLPSSVYQLRKFFSNFGLKKKKTLFCPNCHEEIIDNCTNVNCSRIHYEPDALIQVDLTYQFRSILNRHWNDLSCSNLPPAALIGSNSEFFSCQEHLGLIINTDGIPLFKSSKSTLWPVYLEIINFPPHIRFRYDNVITCSIWVGRSKPDTSILLQPVLEAVNRMNMLGFNFTSPDGIKTVRVKLLYGIFDLVAKANVLCMKQFNGEFGCPTCIHPGEHLAHSRVYLPTTVYPYRTVAGIKKAAEEGSKTGSIIEGIKGNSCLQNHLHLVDGVPPDYMHCVLEGVTKYLLNAWTSPKCRQQPFSLRKFLTGIDSDLLKQTPPHEFSRPPRSIVQDLAHWKASEFRSFLLFYSLPLLVNFLPPLYFHHLSLLVCALHILLLHNISPTQCSIAEEMLNDFYKLLPELYGNRSCTLNAHTLIHIPHYVRMWGPCWNQSAFSFESHNGHLKKMVHSTRKVSEQLSFSLDVKLALQTVYSEVEARESPNVLEFLQYTSHSRRSMCKLRHGYALGTINNYILTDLEFTELKKLCSNVSREVKSFERLFFHNITLHSINYRDGEGKRNSAYCCYKDSESKEAFGQIQKFAECPPLGTIAFLKTLQNTGSNVLEMSGNPCREVLEKYAQQSLVSTFVVEIHNQPLHNSVAIPVNNIISNCVLLTPSHISVSYIVKLPNNYEHY